MPWMVGTILAIYLGLVIWVLVCFQSACTRSMSGDSVITDTDEKE